MTDKIKTNFLVVCDYASLDAQNKASIIGIFRNIMIPEGGLPLMYPSFYVVFNFEAPSVRKYIIQIKLIGPSGEEICPSLPSEVDVKEVKDEGASGGVISRFMNVEFKEMGRYKVEVFVDGIEVEDAIIYVKKV